jgi:hypothetical protein
LPEHVRVYTACPELGLHQTEDRRQAEAIPVYEVADPDLGQHLGDVVAVRLPDCGKPPMARDHRDEPAMTAVEEFQRDVDSRQAGAQDHNVFIRLDPLELRPERVRISDEGIMAGEPEGVAWRGCADTQDRCVICPAGAFGSDPKLGPVPGDAVCDLMNYLEGSFRGSPRDIVEDIGDVIAENGSRWE